MRRATGSATSAGSLVVDRPPVVLLRPLGFALVLGSVRSDAGRRRRGARASVLRAAAKARELGVAKWRAVDHNNRYRLHARQRDALFEALIAA